VLEGYNPNIIPIRNPNNSLFINVDLSLVQIIAMVKLIERKIQDLH
jgi:hypothetical protein